MDHRLDARIFGPVSERFELSTEAVARGYCAIAWRRQKKAQSGGDHELPTMGMWYRLLSSCS